MLNTEFDILEIIEPGEYLFAFDDNGTEYYIAFDVLNDGDLCCARILTQFADGTHHMENYEVTANMWVEILYEAKDLIDEFIADHSEIQ